MLQTRLDRVVHRLTALALILLVAALAATVVVSVRRDSPLDFYVYYIAGDLTGHGQSPYRITGEAWDATAHTLGVTHYTTPYRYPPYTAALVRLLVPLGPRKAMIAWEVASALSLLGGALLLGSALGGGWRLLLTCVALAGFVPAYHTLANGQVNALAFLFLALAFWGLCRGRDLPLGAGIAVAAALKLAPGLLILYLLWRRRWRAALISVAALAALTLVTLPLLGLGPFLDYAPRAFALGEPQTINVSPQNQTVQGAVGRLLVSKASWTVARFSGHWRVHAVRAISAGFAAALLAVTASVLWPGRRSLNARRPVGDRDPGRGRATTRPASLEGQLGFGMVLAVSLVIAPFTFYHQFLWLLILVLVVAVRLIEARRWRLFAVLVALVLVADLNELVWVGVLWAGVFHPLWTRPYEVMLAGGLWRALSLPFVSAVLLWAGAWALIVAERRRQEVPPGVKAQSSGIPRAETIESRP